MHIEYISIAAKYPCFSDSIVSLCNELQINHLENNKINYEINKTFLLVDKSGKVVIESLLNLDKTEIRMKTYFTSYYFNLPTNKINKISKLIVKGNDKLITPKNAFKNYENIENNTILMAINYFNSIDELFLNVNGKHNDFLIIPRK